MKRCMAIAFLLLMTSAAKAQNFAVQQPVVQQMSVDTAVSVPDRGSVLLGGVSSAGSFRQSSGPFRGSTSRGGFTTGSSITTHVWIHDLQEMDQAILNRVESRLSPLSDSDRMEHARDLLRRHRQGRDLQNYSPKEQAANILRRYRSGM